MPNSVVPRIAVVAGELSGDRLGAGLVGALRDALPDAIIEGVGGPGMRDAGCELLFDCEELAVMGLAEVVRHLPRLLRRRRELIGRWSNRPPDVFVGIDAPDFNLGLARRLKASGVATVQYVCPSVWAWRQGRVRTLRRALDHVLCLLPFEPDFLETHGIDATFVGHPMAAEIAAEPAREPARTALGLAGGPVLAVLPGSRHGEVGRLAAPFIATVERLRTEIPGVVAVAALASESTAALFRAAGADAAGIQSVVGRTREVLTAADAVLVASGTATLEAALHARPMVVAYRLSPLTYRIVASLRLVRARHVALPNLLTARAVVPEFIQNDAAPDRLAPAVAALLLDPDRRAEQVREFATLRQTLSRDADQRSAQVVASLLTDRHRADERR